MKQDLQKSLQNLSMKQLENKTTEIKSENEELKYSDLLKAVLMVQPQGGYSVTDMKTRIKLTDLLEKSNGEIILEDADYNYLKPLVNNMKWNIVHKNIVEMTEDFNECEE